jgi:hypothetical protein
MDFSNAQTTGSFWQEDPFGIIKKEEYKGLGIDHADIPPGTVAARRHPPLLSSRFGGNAYGIGLFEIHSHLAKDDIKKIKTVNLDNPDEVKTHYKDINKIYKKIGLLIRVSSLGHPYYLIPSHLLTTSLANIKNKADAISKIIEHHRKKYLKESHKIGVLTHSADPIINDLTLRFKEHQFIIIDSPKKLRAHRETLDLVVLTRDMFRTVLLEMLTNQSKEIPTKKQLENNVIYTLGGIYKILKPGGELFIVANRQQQKTNKTATLKFNTVQEKKNFFIFSHIFKTRKKYNVNDSSLLVNIYDFERYLGLIYVDHDHIHKLTGGEDLRKLSMEDIDKLPYLNISLDNRYVYDQEKTWPKIVSIYFDEVFFKPLIPDTVKDDWKKRFTIKDYSPDYMLVCLAQKKQIDEKIVSLQEDMSRSELAGCPLPLLADYRDSFDYLIRTLTVLKRIKENNYVSLPENFMERLKEPFENNRRRYSGLNHIIRLIKKLKKLETLKSFLNPDMIEGPRTKILENLEILSFFDFSYDELKEIYLITVGHTTSGRILTGKMSEKTLKPVTDLARTYSPLKAMNLLRYCRLMSMAETLASRRNDMSQAQLDELFDLFESALKIVTTRDTNWDRLMDEKISAMGGIHSKLIHKLLMMMSHFEFNETWAELETKGEKEKECLAEYNKSKLARIENVIRLVKNVELFESKFLGNDPLQLLIIYRKILNMEFHGTGHLFENMDSQMSFVLLWLAVNMTRGGIINFNPILADTLYPDMAIRVTKVEEEIGRIDNEFLAPAVLDHLSRLLYENHSLFIFNTGFRFIVDENTQTIDIAFIDIDENIERLGNLLMTYRDHSISNIPIEDLEQMERLFSSLESFYQSHRSLISGVDSVLKIPVRQTEWFRSVRELRNSIRSNFMSTIFKPENIFTDLDILLNHSPSILNLILPEFYALKELKQSGDIYRKTPIIDHILASAKKIQALIRKDFKEFQDIHVLHKLAQREFGPNVAGIVGLNETQIEELSSIINRLRINPHLFDAIVKAFIFQDIGLTPSLRKKYSGDINIADQAKTGALFLLKEKIPEKYGMDTKSEEALLLLIKYHDRLHHLVRGEFTINAFKEVMDAGDKDFFNAFFLSSLVMFSALGEEVISEDLANRLFNIKNLCMRIMDGETSLESFLEELFQSKGRLYFAIEDYSQGNIPKDLRPEEYISSLQEKNTEDRPYGKTGRMIISLERIFRLRGLKYADFTDLAYLIIKSPLKYIYQRKVYYGVGYATFERDLFEALRIYNYIKTLPEAVRYFILEQLYGDRVRIFGFENVNRYLSYDNMIKLLLISLLASKRFDVNNRPVCLNFLSIVELIDRRYEAVNTVLGNISMDRIWYERKQLNRLFKARTGIILEKDEKHRVLSIHFVDKINITRKVSYMDKIEDIDQLKNYHYSLQSLRKNNYYTDDYELILENAFEKRHREITYMMLDQAKRQMEQSKDFKNIHTLFTDLLNRSLEIGFNEDQKYRLNDLYDLRKDHLKREKLEEINDNIEKINNPDDLENYWNNIKLFLLDNSRFLGKEFEKMVARNFDKAAKRIKDMSFQVYFLT